MSFFWWKKQTWNLNTRTSKLTFSLCKEVEPKTSSEAMFDLDETSHHSGGGFNYFQSHLSLQRNLQKMDQSWLHRDKQVFVSLYQSEHLRADPQQHQESAGPHSGPELEDKPKTNQSRNQRDHILDKNQERNHSETRSRTRWRVHRWILCMNQNTYLIMSWF